MADLQVTALFGGLFGLILILLSANVIRTRGSTGIQMGSAGDPLLERRIRAQGNFCEYVPLGLILLATMELTDIIPDWALYLIAAVLLIGRLLHATAFFGEQRWVFGRIGGMVMTLTAIGTMAILCLLHGIKLI